MEKKAKAEAKRQRRSERKQAAEAGQSETPKDAPITADDDLQVESAVTGESS